MTDNQLRAHDLFFHTDLNQLQIADILNVNRKTLYCWIKEGKWIRAKYAASHAPVVLTEQYYAQLAAINNKIAERDEPFPTKEESDIIRKISAALRHIRDGRRTFSETIELFTDFTSKLMTKDASLTRQVIVHMDDYIKEMTDEGRVLNRGKHLRQEKELEKEYEEWINTHPAAATDSLGQSVIADEAPNEASPTAPGSAQPVPATTDDAGHTVIPGEAWRDEWPAAPNSAEPIPAATDSVGQSVIADEAWNEVCPPAHNSEEPVLATTDSVGHTVIADGVQSGVLFSVSTPPEPAPVTTIAKNDHANLSTAKKEKWGKVRPRIMSGPDTKRNRPSGVPQIT